MCWGVEIWDGDKIAKTVSTTGEAIAAFGPEAIRFSDGSPLNLSEPHDYCMCPVDFDHLFKTAGLVRIPETDKRWSSIDVAVEKSPAPEGERP